MPVAVPVPVAVAVPVPVPVSELERCMAVAALVSRVVLLVLVLVRKRVLEVGGSPVVAGRRCGCHVGVGLRLISRRVRRRYPGPLLVGTWHHPVGADVGVTARLARATAVFTLAAANFAVQHDGRASDVIVELALHREGGGGAVRGGVSRAGLVLSRLGGGAGEV